VPNTYITPSLIASTALATLHHAMVLANLVWRDFDADFTGKQGDTVTIRKPATFTAEEFDRAQGITLQDVTEDSTTVSIDTIANVSVAVTDEEMTLSVNDFRTQILNGMVFAIAEKIDGDLAELLVDTANGAGGGGVADGTTTPTAAYRQALAILGRNKLPLTERYAVLSPEAHADVLGEDKLIKVNESGTSNALRQAIIGDLLAFVNYTSGVFGNGPATAARPTASRSTSRRWPWSSARSTRRRASHRTRWRGRTSTASRCASSTRTTPTRSRTRCRSTSCTARRRSASRAPSSSTSARAPSPQPTRHGPSP
jgi:hypothetical protein